jgi:hypothetical protein
MDGFPYDVWDSREVPLPAMACYSSHSRDDHLFFNQEKVNQEIQVTFLGGNFITGGVIGSGADKSCMTCSAVLVSPSRKSSIAFCSLIEQAVKDKNSKVNNFIIKFPIVLQILF